MHREKGGLNKNMAKIQSQYDNKDFLYNEYVTKEKSSTEIAKELGLNNQKILKWLCKYDIKRRSVSEAKNIVSPLRSIKRDFLYEMYVNQKMSCNKIANKIGISDTSVSNLLKKFDIETAPTSNYIEDFTGKRFGKILVLERDFEKEKYDKAKNIYFGTCWKCSCDCGNFITLRASSFTRNDRRNTIRTCGRRHSEQGNQEIAGHYIKRLESNAKRREIEFNIDVDDIWNQFLKQERCCALTGWPLRFEKDTRKRTDQTASVDRIDSDKVYIPENIQIVHKDINFIKSDYSQEEFLYIVNSIYNHQTEKSFDQIDYII